MNSTAAEPADASAVPIMTAARMINNTIAVASLNRLSPSTRMVRRLGAPRSLKIATTATGSVAETMAPSSRQATKPKPEIASMAKPTAKVEINRPTTASIRIGFMSFSRWRTLMLMADSKISAGKKRKKHCFGGDVEIFDGVQKNLRRYRRRSCQG